MANILCELAKYFSRVQSRQNRRNRLSPEGPWTLRSSGGDSMPRSVRECTRIVNSEMKASCRQEGQRSDLLVPPVVKEVSALHCRDFSAVDVGPIQIGQHCREAEVEMIMGIKEPPFGGPRFPSDFHHETLPRSTISQRWNFLVGRCTVTRLRRTAQRADGWHLDL
mmetsp:Transcript_20468/g.34095  ORF Transcript_20468/g.34095 Transcript_20468/m.34095 type:complete len:166 (+) Transcript_20468:106-603(+)